MTNVQDDDSYPDHESPRGNPPALKNVGPEENGAVRLSVQPAGDGTLSLDIHVLNNECSATEAIGNHRDEIVSLVQRSLRRSSPVTVINIQIFKHSANTQSTNHALRATSNTAVQSALTALFSLNFTNIKVKVKYRDIFDGEFIEAEHKPASPLGVGDAFAEFLKDNGVDDTKAASFLDRFIAEKMPDLAVLAAVKELRELHKRERVRDKPIFPGRKSDVDAVGYLLRHYGDDIRANRLGPGRVQVLDKHLYNSVNIALSNTTPRPEFGGKTIAQHYFPEGDPPASIRELFDRLSAKGVFLTPLEERARACAIVLDSTDEEAARFFSTLRTDRVYSNPAMRGGRER